MTEDTVNMHPSRELHIMTVGALRAKGYDQIDIESLGKCLVVPASEFQENWRFELAKTGHDCVDCDVPPDGKHVVLVKLALDVGLMRRSSVMHVPRPEPAVVPSHVEGVKETEKKESAKKSSPMLRGPNWTEEEDRKLLAAYDAYVAEKGSAYGSTKVLRGLFEWRSVSACEQRLKRLMKKRKKADVTTAAEPANDANVQVAQAHKPPVSAEQKSVELSIEVLQQAYDALSKGYVELKTEFNRLEDFVHANLSVKNQLTALDRGLRKHKHAVGSGEAMLPMEATS